MLTTIELKEKLITKISNTDNVELLAEISRIFEFEEDADAIYHISPDELIAVNEGIQQIENGMFFTHEESNKRIAEWLGKFDGQ